MVPSGGFPRDAGRRRAHRGDCGPEFCGFGRAGGASRGREAGACNGRPDPYAVCEALGGAPDPSTSLGYRLLLLYNYSGHRDVAGGPGTRVCAEPGGKGICAGLACPKTGRHCTADRLVDLGSDDQANEEGVEEPRREFDHRTTPSNSARPLKPSSIDEC